MWRACVSIMYLTLYTFIIYYQKEILPLVIVNKIQWTYIHMYLLTGTIKVGQVIVICSRQGQILFVVPKDSSDPWFLPQVQGQAEDSTVAWPWLGFLTWKGKISNSVEALEETVNSGAKEMF